MTSTVAATTVMAGQRIWDCDCWKMEGVTDVGS